MLQKGYNLSDATVFFQSIMSKPWINQLVLAPHIYCPGVTSATICYSGQELFTGLDQSFGYLTVSPGLLQQWHMQSKSNRPMASAFCRADM